MSAVNNVAWADVDKGRLVMMMPLGSLSVRSLVFPISLIKTRMQVGEGAYGSVPAAFRTIVRTEGPAALYKGFGTSLLGLVVGPVYISTLEMSKEALGPHLSSPVATAAASGFCASVVAQVLGVPVDIVSQRRMVQGVGIKQAGGILRAANMLATAEAAGLPVVLGHGFGLDPSTMAEIMLGATQRNVVPGLECVGPLKVVDSVATTPIDLSTGSIALHTGPGLGISLDDGKLEQYQLT